MAFILYKKEKDGEKIKFINENKSYKLAGRNLVYESWIGRDRPLNQGWSISVNEMLAKADINRNSDNSALVIDFDPKSLKRIGLIEIIKIHCYTYSDKNGDNAKWTPMMLELKDVFIRDGFDGLSQENKTKEISIFYEKENENSYVEFLYLNGDDNGWNWGRNGGTNAAFISGGARKYFKQFF